MKRILPFLLSTALSTSAFAAGGEFIFDPDTHIPFNSSNPFPVSGTFSASFSGFAPASTGTPISVTTANSTGSLPAGTVVVVSNAGGTNSAYCALGAAATTSSQPIPPNSWFAYTVGAATQLTCVTSTSTTTVNMTGGAGLPTGAGGGGGGSGSSSTITNWGSGSNTLGAMANYGTSPGAVLVPGMNASITASVLPTGASSAANQTNVQSAAGTPQTTALTVQGNAGGVAVPISGTVSGTGTFTVSGTVTANAGTNLNTSLLGTDAHLTAFTSANHTDLAAINTTLGTPFQAAGALGAGSANIGSVNILGHAGATLDSAAGAAIGQALAIQGVTGGVAVPVTGTLSASIGAFQPTPGYASLNVTGASARVVLPSGVDIIVYNSGANPAYVLLGNSSVVATTANDIILPNSWVEYAVGSAVDLAAIETAGTTSLTISGGAGIAAGSVGVPPNQTIAQATAANLNATVVGTGTFATQSAITAASGSVSSGAFASGSVSSGAFASGSVSSGALAAGSISSGAAVSGAFATGAIADLALAQGTTTSGKVGNMIFGAVTTAAPTYTTAQLDPLSLTTGGSLRVDGSGATQPISGTVTANAGTNLNTSALALETGGNLASVKTDVDNLNLAQGSTTSGQKGNVIFGAVTTGAPTYTTAQSNPLSLTTTGALRVDGSAVTQPVSGTFWQATQPISGTVSGTGTFTVSGTVTANAGTNLNTSLLATDAHLTAIQGTVTNGAAAANSVLDGCIFNTSLPTLTTGQGAAVQCDNNARQLVSVANTPNVILGSGSNTIGALTANQTINISQVGANTITTAASGTIMTGIEGHTGAILDAALTSATAPTNGIAVLQQYNTSAPTPTTGQTVALQADSSGNLKVNVAAGAGGGTAAVDGATWSVGSSSNTPIGCEFTTGGATALTTAHMGNVGCTAARGLFSDIESIGGTGSFANYGSTPSAVPSVPVNAFVTNTNTNGSAVSANSSPVVIASDQAAVAIKAASGAIASGAIASGAVASGAYASGSFAAGAIADGGDTTLGAKADAKASTTDATPITIMQVLKEISAMEQAPVGRSPYPVGATAETASATGTTAATTATLATAVGKTTYICSLSIRANATAAVTGNATVTGTITGTLNYTQWTAPLASGLGVTEEIFTPCVPASTTNTAIAVVSAAPGTGGVVSVSATGYQL